MYKLYYLTSLLDCFQPRYIGYTTREDISERLKEHISESKYFKTRSHKVNWIVGLLRKDINPIIIEMESTNNIDHILELERNYIEEFKNWYKLTNSTNGGESSKTFTQDVKDKISQKLKEYYKYNDNWNKGRSYKMLEDVKIKRRIGIGDKINGENNHFYGKHHSMETKKLLSSKNRQYDYDYKMFYEFYIVKNMDRNEMSLVTGLPVTFIGKMIFKYKLTPIKKIVYGKIKGKKIHIDDEELLYRYYDFNRIWFTYKIYKNMISEEIKIKYDKLDIQNLNKEITKLNKLKIDYLNGDKKLGTFKEERMDYLELIINYLTNRVKILRDNKLKHLLEYKLFFVNSIK